MTDSTIAALFDAVAADASLAEKFRSAHGPQALAKAVVAAGFDPADPEIAAALAASEEISENDLEAMSGGAQTGGIRYDSWR